MSEAQEIYVIKEKIKNNVDFCKEKRKKDPPRTAPQAMPFMYRKLSNRPQAVD